MASKIKSLKALDFVKTIKGRNAKIDEAAATPVKKTNEYLANYLAKSLHPSCQYLKIAKIIDEQDGVKTYVFAPDYSHGTEKLAYFSAGQYLSVSLEIGDAKLTRPYSLASAPKSVFKTVNTV
jgi:Flavodoxin reductases (ferredoxin-NADPH reductases) family 1